MFQLEEKRQFCISYSCVKLWHSFEMCIKQSPNIKMSTKKTSSTLCSKLITVAFCFFVVFFSITFYDLCISKFTKILLSVSKDTGLIIIIGNNVFSIH